jgi:hypothetical protein
MAEPCGHSLCDASVTVTKAAGTPVSKLNQQISTNFSNHKCSFPKQKWWVIKAFFGNTFLIWTNLYIK